MTPIHDGKPQPGPAILWLMIKLSTNTQPLGTHRISGNIKSHSVDVCGVAHRCLFAFLSIRILQTFIYTFDCIAFKLRPIGTNF